MRKSLPCHDVIIFLVENVMAGVAAHGVTFMEMVLWKCMPHGILKDHIEICTVRYTFKEYLTAISLPFSRWNVDHVHLFA